MLKNNLSAKIYLILKNCFFFKQNLNCEIFALIIKKAILYCRSVLPPLPTIAIAIVGKNASIQS